MIRICIRTEWAGGRRDTTFLNFSGTDAAWGWLSRHEPSLDAMPRRGLAVTAEHSDRRVTYSVVIS